MLAGSHARRLIAAGLTLLSAGLLAACHSGDAAGSAYPPGPAVSTQEIAVARAAPTHLGLLGDGQERPGTDVPWSQVGPGWVLAVYAAFPLGEGGQGPQTLYLVDPAGGRYVLDRSRVTGYHATQLEDWSAAARRALVRVPSSEIDLASGKPVSLGNPSLDAAIFSQPAGDAIISPSFPGAGPGQLDELEPTGRKVLATGSFLAWPAYAPGDATLAIGERNGVALVKTGGGLLRWLRVPVSGDATCTVARWWNANTVLATCSAGAQSRGLWLVPADSARPVLLAGADQDPVGAWQLPAGRYLQVESAQRQGELVRETANGSLSRVRVPGAGTIQVLTADGSRLLVLAAGFGKTQSGLPGITGAYSLLWFNPATGAEQWLFDGRTARRNLITAVPFPTIDSVHDTGL